MGRIIISIGFLLTMVIQALISNRTLGWWLFQIGFLLMILLVWTIVLFIKKRYKQD